MQICYKIFLPILIATSVFNVGRVFAENNGSSKVVEEVEVFADDLRYEIKVDRLESANILGTEAIQRIQSADVFDLLSSMPGIDIEGGITTGGKSFSIRGFGNNEDVLIQIDGVTQNFEKYRAGTGVEIEPELLKEIAVFRGGTSVAQGAGYLGGVVQMETKDARDFLKDEKIGAIIRLGWKDNNDEKFQSYTGYALPFDGIDVLINAVSRKTNDLTQANGEPFNNSDEQQESLLVKVEHYTTDSILSYSYRESEDVGLEPFDLISNCNDASSTNTLCRDMLRETSEAAHSFRGQYNPPNSLIDFDFVIGYIDKSVVEQTDQGGSFEASFNFPIGYFQYDIWNLNLKNVSELAFHNISSRWTYGIQSSREKRISKQDRDGSLIEYTNQPSGLKSTKAAYADVVLDYERLRFQVGLRHDDYEVSSEDDRVAGFTAERFGDEKIRFSQTTPSFSIDYNLGLSTFFYRQSEAFRAPLVTQYFAPSATNASDQGTCANFSEISFPPEVSSFTGSAINIAIQHGQALADWEQNTPEWQKEEAFFCGDVYKPEEATTKEGGILIDFPFASDDQNLASKLTYFDINRKHKLNSLYQDPATLEVSQPNTESRYGFEAEINYFNMAGWMVSFNYSKLRGKRIDVINDVEYITGLRAPPGDSINLHISKTGSYLNSRVGLMLRGVKSRKVDQNLDRTMSAIDARYERIPGYVVANTYATFDIDSRWIFKTSINNIFNKNYQLRGFGGGIGNVSAGRDYRLTTSYIF